MSNEIKEILEDLKMFIQHKYLLEDVLDVEKARLLLDYITNLQQKVEQYENPDDLTLFYMWLDEKAKDKMKHLQQENDDKDWKIKTLNEQLNDLTDNWISRGKKIEDLQQENERLKERLNRYNKYTCLRSKIMLDDYKSKCEKAFEVLKQDKQSASFNSAEALAISILEGGKDDNKKEGK